MPDFAVRHALAVLPIAFALLAGCTRTPDNPPAPSEAASAPAATFTVTGATVQMAMLPHRPAVAYFTLTAAPGATGTLVSVEVAHFGRAEMHESKMDSHGAMTMAPVDKLPIPPGHAIAFAPGGLHVMLFDPDAAIHPGAMTDLTATLAGGTKISTKAKVTGLGGDSAGTNM